MKKTENFEAPPLSFSGIEENKKRNGLKINEIASRKKILGEQNGVSSCSNSPEKHQISNPHEVSCGSAGSDITSNHRFRISPLISSSASKIPKSDQGEGKGDKKSAPYDPTTNFLSPRPKFLRYNPNWRREIALSRAKIEDLSSDVESQGDTEQEELSVSALVSSSLSSLGGDLIKDETCGDVEESNGAEIEEEDVEEEEDEEEVVGSFMGLKWAFKLLLVLSVLFLSTAYISTMNSLTPPPAVQTLKGLRVECQRVGTGLLKNLFEMKKSHGSEELGVGLFEIEVSDYNAMAVEDEDVEEEIAQQLGEVELDERGFEGDSHGESEEIGKEMSYDVAVYVGNGGIFEVGNGSFDGLQIVEEVVETEANVVSYESEELDGSSTNEESISIHGSSIDSCEDGKLLQKEEVNDGLTQNEKVSDGLTQKEEVNDEGGEQEKSEILLNLKNKMAGLSTTATAITTKDPILVAVLSLLVAVGASLALRFHFNCKKTSSKTSSYPVAAEAGVPKKAPCLPPTPPRPHENIMPQVKLLGELDFGDVSSPVQNYNHTRNQRYVSISPTHSLRYLIRSEDWTMDSAASYGSFITEEKITQKKEGKQVAAAADMGLSGTPVRRSMRIRNRKVTSP